MESSASKIKISYGDYGQYLLSTQTNFTLTYYADHVQRFSHDRINAYLKNTRLPPRSLWQQIKDEVVASPNGYVVFDDTVLDKRHSHKIELVRSQYSGNEHGIIKGIGVVTCVYVNPDINQFWAIDWRVFSPESDGKTKLNHMRDMLQNIHDLKQLLYRAVLMDTWYATRELMLFIEETLHKIFYCPLKTNRLVDDSAATQPYCAVRDLAWTEDEQKGGKRVKIKGFPRDHKVRLFRVPVSSNRTDFVATNDPSVSSAEDVRSTCAQRWKIEQLHREIKQTCGIERCQCRKERIQRNHIACSFLVWARLKSLAYQTAQNIYALKQSLLDAYLTAELKKPAIHFIPA